MSEKPLCGHCYNECTDDCCDKRRIDVLELQLAEDREEETRFLNMLIPYIHPSSTCEVYKSVCRRIEQLKEQGR